MDKTLSAEGFELQTYMVAPSGRGSSQHGFKPATSATVAEVGLGVRGEGRESRPPTVRKLAEALGVDPIELVE